MLRQGNVSMALDKTSRMKRMNQAFVTFGWLVSFHLVVNGVLAEIEIAAQDPSGRLYNATAPVLKGTKPASLNRLGNTAALML